MLVVARQHRSLDAELVESLDGLLARRFDSVGHSENGKHTLCVEQRNYRFTLTLQRIHGAGKDGCGQAQLTDKAVIAQVVEVTANDTLDASPWQRLELLDIGQLVQRIRRCFGDCLGNRVVGADRQAGRDQFRGNVSDFTPQTVICLYGFAMCQCPGLIEGNETELGAKL
ncbi:hypothetical protein WR25_02510 [Diploscapter pachys]|uniref:Uncharacterized protein n=1 Tax=Diploscapter pachys TaxID=2018661 RepID=A0A2A2K2E7_9BILA|nr:hypothetical protein WR25_02510 [Diploscapter pachys]